MQHHVQTIPFVVLALSLVNVLSIVAVVVYLPLALDVDLRLHLRGEDVHRHGLRRCLTAHAAVALLQLFGVYANTVYAGNNMLNVLLFEVANLS